MQSNCTKIRAIVWKIQRCCLLKARLQPRQQGVQQQLIICVCGVVRVCSKFDVMMNLLLAGTGKGARDQGGSNIQDIEGEQGCYRSNWSQN